MRTYVVIRSLFVKDNTDATAYEAHEKQFFWRENVLMDPIPRIDPLWLYFKKLNVYFQLLFN